MEHLFGEDVAHHQSFCAHNNTERDNNGNRDGGGLERHLVVAPPGAREGLEGISHALAGGGLGRGAAQGAVEGHDGLVRVGQQRSLHPEENHLGRDGGEKHQAERKSKVQDTVAAHPLDRVILDAGDDLAGLHGPTNGEQDQGRQARSGERREEAGANGQDGGLQGLGEGGDAAPPRLGRGGNDSVNPGGVQLDQGNLCQENRHGVMDAWQSREEESGHQASNKLSDEGEDQATEKGAPAERGSGAEMLVDGPDTRGDGRLLDGAGFLGLGRGGFGGGAPAFTIGCIDVADRNGRVGLLGGFDRDERGDDAAQRVTDLGGSSVQSCPRQSRARRGLTHVKQGGKEKDQVGDIKERGGQLHRRIVVPGLQRAEMDADGRGGQLLVPVDRHHDSPGQERQHGAVDSAKRKTTKRLQWFSR